MCSCDLRSQQSRGLCGPQRNIRPNNSGLFSRSLLFAKQYEMRVVSLFVAVLSLFLLLQQGARGQALHKIQDAAERLRYLSEFGEEAEEARNGISAQLLQATLFWSEELPNAVEEGSDVRLAISDECKAGFGKIGNATDDLGLPLIADMIDAWGKPGAGYLEGNTYALGSYDQCFSTDLMRYCVGTVNAPIASSIIPVPLSLQLAMCVPKECTEEDLATVINDTSILVVNASTILCTLEQRQPYNAGAIIMLAITALLIIVVIGATIFDYILKYLDTPVVKKDTNIQDSDKSDKSVSDQTPLYNTTAKVQKTRPKAFDLLTAFSLYKTVPVVLSTKQPSAAITSINGLRVISMFWVILCHTHFWMFIYGSENTKYLLYSVARRFSYQAILNGFFCVDTFFFLSGLLVAYLTLREMSRRKPGFNRFPFLMYYIHRILRLTPAYAFVLFGFWFLSPHLANGPVYNQAAGVGSAVYDNCVKYWWTNLLYINNLYPWKLADECMGWTWYLANDMQFYILAPLIMIPLFVHFAFGLAIAAIFLAVSFAITAGLTGGLNLQASQFAALIYNYTPNADYAYGDVLYIKPYHRIMTYVVGILFGYLIYRKAQFPFANLSIGNYRIGRFVNLGAYMCLWILAAVICFICVYGLYPILGRNPPSLTPWLVNDYIPSVAENVFYNTFSRFAWGVGLALIVFCCHNGYGGWVNKFLSLGFWVPLSRLTFMAYLVHEIVLTSVFGSQRAPTHYNDIVLAVFAIGNTVLAFGVAFVLAVFVEFPLGNLEMAVFKLLGVSRRESARHGTEADKNAKPLKQTNYASIANTDN